MADAFAGFFAQKCEAAACTAAEATLVRTRRFHDFACQGRDLARFVVDVAISTQIARIMVSDCFTSLLVGKAVGKASEELTVMLDWRWCAEFLPVFLNCAYTMRADRDDLFHFVLRKTLEIGFGQLLKDQVVAESTHRVPSALFLA